MNILRKTRKSKFKLDKKKIILLIFTLIMTTFAWITYSKILLPNLQLHINSWNISIYVDNNKNGVADDDELVEDKSSPITIQPFEVYPGMNLDVMDVIIKNNGETPSDIAYIISDISILGNQYSTKEDAAAYRLEHPEEFCLQQNSYETDAGIVTYKLINEESLIPFDFIIEHTQIIDGGAEGYLKVKAVWNATLEDDATEEEIEEKNEFDGKWGFDLTNYAQAIGAPIEFKVKINAIGQPRSSRFVLTQDITPENYGDYIEYSIDLNGDGDLTNDWRIFYEDNENIYIIADGLLNNESIDETILDKSTTESCNTYGVNIPQSKLIGSSIIKATINKFMFTGAKETENNNYRAAGNLLSIHNWDQFVDTDVAEAAIGSPTVEMFVRSWNQKYKDIDECTKIICEWNTPRQGYQVNDVDGEEDSIQLTGYENASLYFPIHTGDACYAYWLASPSIKRIDPLTGSDIAKKGLMEVRFDTAWISGEGTENGKTGIRPVVRLKAGLSGTSEVNGNGDTVWTIEQETSGDTP